MVWIPFRRKVVSSSSGWGQQWKLILAILSMVWLFADIPGVPFYLKGYIYLIILGGLIVFILVSPFWKKYKISEYPTLIVNCTITNFTTKTNPGKGGPGSITPTFVIEDWGTKPVSTMMTNGVPRVTYLTQLAEVYGNPKKGIHPFEQALIELPNLWTKVMIPEPGINFMWKDEPIHNVRVVVGCSFNIVKWEPQHDSIYQIPTMKCVDSPYHRLRIDQNNPIQEPLTEDEKNKYKIWINSVPNITYKRQFEAAMGMVAIKDQVILALEDQIKELDVKVVDLLRFMSQREKDQLAGLGLLKKITLRLGRWKYVIIIGILLLILAYMGNVFGFRDWMQGIFGVGTG